MPWKTGLYYLSSKDAPGKQCSRARQDGPALMDGDECEGGFGKVYRSVRDGTLERSVGLSSKDKRFREEV